MTPTPSRPGPPTGTKVLRRSALLLLAAGLLTASLGLFSASSKAEAEPQTYTVVRHILYRSADGSLTVEEAESRTIEQFVVNPHIWSASNLPVNVRYNATGAPAGIDVQSLVQNAIGTWNAVTNTFAFVYGGDTSDDTGSCMRGEPEVDGINTIAFNDDIGPLSLGETCTIFPNTGSNTKLVEFDMRLNPDDIWFTGNQPVTDKYDIATTILHELGHAAGLGHSSNRESVMYFQLNDGVIRRALHSDDIAGLLQAYPGGASPTPTPSPTTAAVTPPPITTVPPPPGAFKVRTLQLARD